MKRIITLIIIMTGCLGAVEITVQGGANYQKLNTWDYFTYDEPRAMNFHGLGFNAAGLLSVGFTKPAAPAFIGLETGVMYTRLNYTEILDTSNSISSIQAEPVDTTTPEEEPQKLNFNKLVFPVLLKIMIPATPGLEWGISIGPAPVVDPNGGFDLALQTKGNIGIRILPKVWLTPSLAACYNITADEKNTSKVESERVFLFSVGLVYKI